MPSPGIEILEIIPGSAADKLGIVPGERILTANDHEITDELALRFYFADERVVLRLRRANGSIRRVRINTDEIGDFGVRVAEFPTRRCGNACMFCFVDQLPPGVRSNLLIKDDDYRLSFLYGNYVTLTNTTRKDIDRIIAQHLSPLYVSVHATDPELRARILGRKKTDDLAGKLARLVQGGVRIHAQIVLMPGVNDGAQLEKTIFDLYRLHPGVESVAIVPVGISDHVPPDRRLCPVTPSFSRALLRRIHRWRRQFIESSGSAFVFPADEFQLLAGESIPECDYYEDFFQIEDGIGMVRNFLDDFAASMARQRKPAMNLNGTLVTGELFFPVLKRSIQEWNLQTGAELKVCAIENHFLGKRINVAGLVAGRDILMTLRGKHCGDFVIIPGEALSFGNQLFLDDLTMKDLKRELRVPVYSGGRTVKDFFRLMTMIKKKHCVA